MAKSTAKLKRIAPSNVGDYMKANGLSSIVAVDEVNGWLYRLRLYDSGGNHYIGGNLIVCSYDDTTKKYNLVEGSANDSVTKVRNLPCYTDSVSLSEVEEGMSNFLGNLKTIYYEIDEVTAELRTNKVGDGSGLTYDDLDVTVWINDEG